MTVTAEWEALWEDYFAEAHDFEHEGAIYARISDDREGLERGVGRQVEDGIELARTHRVRVRKEHIFVDNDRGASDLSKKPRPDYDSMLKLAGDRTFRFVLAYSNSRLTRRPREFEDLIQLHLHCGVEYKTKVSGDDDLSTADGRFVARIKANADAAEAERTGERVRRQRLQAAREGRTWTSGGRAFGWLDDRETEHPVEAELIRRAALDIIAGKPMTHVAREWNAMGVRTARGNEWSPAQLGQLLKSPRLAGWRVHHGEIATDRDGQPVRGQWDVILDQDTFDRLHIARTADQRVRVRIPRRGRRQYMLSSYARCGICGGPMSGQRISDTIHNYSCSSNPASRDHGNTASGRAVDRIVTARVLLKAKEADLEPVEPQPFEGQARLEQVDRELREVMLKIRTGSNIPKAMLWAEAEGLGAEKDELEKGRTDWLRDTSGPAPTPDLTLEQWKVMPIYEQQAHIEATLGPVIIQPPVVTRTGSRFDPERVMFPHDGLVSL